MLTGGGQSGPTPLAFLPHEASDVQVFPDRTPWDFLDLRPPDTAVVAHRASDGLGQFLDRLRAWGVPRLRWRNSLNFLCHNRDFPVTTWEQRRLVQDKNVIDEFVFQGEGRCSDLAL